MPGCLFPVTRGEIIFAITAYTVGPFVAYFGTIAFVLWGGK